MIVKLYNVNWPSDLRNSVVEALRADGGKVRSAKHRNKLSGFYFYLIEVSELSQGDVLSIVQETFLHYATITPLEETCEFTVNTTDIIATKDGVFKHYTAFRDIILMGNMFGVLQYKINHDYPDVQIRHFKHGYAYDIFISPGCDEIFLSTLWDVIDTYSVQGAADEITYTYNFKTYKYTQLPNQPVAPRVYNCECNVSYVQPKLVDYMKDMLYWYAGTSVRQSEWDVHEKHVTQLYFIATKEALLKAFTCAYAAFLCDIEYTGDMLFTVNSEHYVFDFERKEPVKVIALKDIVDTEILVPEIDKHLHSMNIFSYYYSGVWYIEAKHYREFLRFGEKLLKKHPEAKLCWQH